MSTFPPSASLDEIDLRILAILQKDSRTVQRDIGSAVNLSAAAVHRRIRRLEEAGIIVAETAQLAPELLGYPITIVAQVSVVSEKPEKLEATRRAFRNAPEVQQCYYVTGDVDFILVLVMPSLTEYEAFTRRMFFADNNVRRFQTYIVMERVKVGLAVPLEGRAG